MSQSPANIEAIECHDERQPLVVYFNIELDDAGLDPYEFRVYNRIARRCSGNSAGQCKESAAKMALDCQMSRAQLFEALHGLLSRGMVRRISELGKTTIYKLTDKSQWHDPEKIERKKPGPIHPVDGSTHPLSGQDPSTQKMGGIHSVDRTHPPNGHMKNKESSKENRESPLRKTAFSKPVLGLGDALEKAYPGHATNVKIMRELGEVVSRLKATADDVLAFHGWLKANYPFKADGPLTFKDLFPESIAGKQQQRARSAGQCPRCKGQKAIYSPTADGRTRFIDCPACSPQTTTAQPQEITR